MNHPTDELLNEYLDHELADRAQVEKHIAACADCATRLAALEKLFADLKSLPEESPSRDLAARFPQTTSLPAALPRSLQWTMILQTVAALAVSIIAAPFVAKLAAPFLAAFEIPTFSGISVQLESQWMAWLDSLAAIQAPNLSEIPMLGLSSLYTALVAVAAFFLWLFGNRMFIKNTK